MKTPDHIAFGFVGAEALGLKVLTHLLKANLIPQFILTLPDQSSREIAQFRQMANDHNIPCYVEGHVNNHKVELAACHFVLLAHFHMIAKNHLDLPKWGFINLHPALLPAYRGEHPISWALIHGEAKTGVTAHYATEKANSGDIIAQRSLSILPHHNIHSLTAALNQLAGQLAVQVVNSILNSKKAPSATEQGPGNYVKARTEKDSLIDWTLPADQIKNLLRALQPPYPLAFTLNRDGEKIEFINARTVVCTQGSSGDVIAVHPPKSVTVRCQHHAVVLECKEPVHLRVGDSLSN